MCIVIVADRASSNVDNLYDLMDVFSKVIMEDIYSRGNGQRP